MFALNIVTEQHSTKLSSACAQKRCQDIASSCTPTYWDDKATSTIVRLKEEMKNCAEVLGTKEHKDFCDQLTCHQTIRGEEAQGRVNEQTDESTRDTLKDKGLALQRGKSLHSTEKKG